MTPTQRLQRIATDVQDTLEQTHPGLALQAGRPVRGLPTLDALRLEAEAAVLTAFLVDLQGLDLAELSPTEKAFHRALALDLERRVEAATGPRLAFAVTPYRGGDLHFEARAALAAHPLENAQDAEAYLCLVRDYGRLLSEILQLTKEQAADGVFLHAAALPGARAMLLALRSELDGVVRPARGRGAWTSRDEAQMDLLLRDELAPPLEATVAFLDEDYAARSLGPPGLARFTLGEGYYRQQIRLFGDTDLTPQAVHALGLDMLEQLAASRAGLRAKLAPQLDAAAFHRLMLENRRARARTPGEIEACFLGHMGRVEPLMAQWFLRQPRSPWAVTRADPVSEQGMTFGQYQRPSPSDPVGRYRYNGAAPETLSLIGAAHLIYHELLPGHHYQLSLQDEIAPVHPLQKNLLSMATIEGWAVYASSLAAEMGAMDAFDLYGHSLMQGFIAARLVVDTGLNAMGWSLEQGREFLREHTIESEATIESEVLRYATDIPGQAVAYGLGGKAIAELRDEAQSALGPAFDVRVFHDRLLAEGGYPLPVIAQGVRDWVAGQPPRTLS